MYNGSWTSTTTSSGGWFDMTGQVYVHVIHFARNDPPPPPPPRFEVPVTDLLSALGLEEGATPNMIRRAFRSLAKAYHPDVNPGAAERMKSISAAYNALKQRGLA